MSGPPGGRSEPRQRLGLWIGLALFAFLVFLPLPGMLPSVRKMVAVTLLMAVWWVSQAIPLAATSLLPLVLFPALGIGSPAEAAAPYANHLVFLFMGGFMLAQAMQRWNLHRRIALHIVRVVGTSPRRMVLGFMCATAFISLWVSNTATAAMMMPIGLAVIHQVSEAARERGAALDLTPGRFHFGIDLMLGIAYAASIGGTGTIIGTPPNVLLVGALEESFGVQVSFLRWLCFGLPFVLVYTTLTWLWLTRIAYPIELAELPGGKKLVEEQIRNLGPPGAGERRTAVIFAATAAAWMSQPLWTPLLPSGDLIADSTIAIAAALALFLTPASSGERVLDWPWASRLPWDVLLLFGGGFALAEGFEMSGLSAWMGAKLTLLSQAPLPFFVLGMVTLMVVLTEFASNTAAAAMSVPILGAAAIGMGFSPLFLCIPGVLGASCGFMMPAGTPPNAIVFGTGYVTIPQMVRAGLFIDLIGIALITLITFLIIRPLFGI